MSRQWLTLLAIAVLGLGCSSVKIRTGPPTDEEYTSQSEVQARQFKTEWYHKLDQENAEGKTGLVNELINQTVVGYIRFGRNVADTWRRSNDSRPKPVHASEILKMVEQSTATDQPMIQAQTDVIEFAVNEIIGSGYFDPGFVDDLNEYRDFFNEVYNGVFLPNGAVDDYVAQLDRLETRQAQYYEQISEKLRRY